MIRTLANIIFVLVIASTNAFAAPVLESGITLPLGGYCRVGRYLPVRVVGEASDAPIVAGAGVVPVAIRDREMISDVVVPVLVTSDQPAIDRAAALRVLSDNQRLVGLVGPATAGDARSLFPDREVIALKIDWPLAGPAMAWESLDTIVIAGADAPDGVTISTLLGAGVTFAMRSAQRPDMVWPWRDDGRGWWILNHRPLGPSGSAFDASFLLASWSPGVSADARRIVVLIGAIVVILALAASLRRGRAAMVTLASVVAGSCLAIGLWTARQSPIRAAGGVIEVVSPPLRQSDVWLCETSVRDAQLQVRAAGMIHPLADADQLKQTGLTLVCDREGKPLHFEWQAKGGTKLAFLSRRVQPTDLNPATLANALTRSPLRMIAQEAYQGGAVIGEGADAEVQSDAVERWSSVILAPGKPSH